MRARSSKLPPLPREPHPQSRRRRQYDRELEQLQGHLALLTRRSKFRKHGLVLAFEGMDAAGKGGAIRRITHALDARQYQVVPVSAPTAEERLYPYLWRFWRDVPERGHIAIFDRSWYGRVLVERVRGFAAPADWRRAYAEICEFERQLTEHGLVVAKFWLQVSKAEQLRRFKERDEDPLKRFKVDPEDWTNRSLYDAYQAGRGGDDPAHPVAASALARRAGRRQEERASARAARGLRGHRGSAGPLRVRKNLGVLAMRRMLMSLTALCSLAALDAAQALEVRFYPTGKVRAYELDADRGVRSVVLQNVAIINDGDADVTISQVMLEVTERGVTQEIEAAARRRSGSHGGGGRGSAELGHAEHVGVPVRRVGVVAEGHIALGNARTEARHGTAGAAAGPRVQRQARRHPCERPDDDRNEGGDAVHLDVALAYGIRAAARRHVVRRRRTFPALASSVGGPAGVCARLHAHRRQRALLQR